MKYKFKYSYIIYTNLIFSPFCLCLFYTCCSISHRITQRCIRIAFVSSFGFFTLPTGCFNLTIFCCLFMWGFYIFGPLLTIYIGIFACTQCIQLVRCFGVRGLCFSIRVYIWAFSNASLFASLSFISFCVCILLVFSSASLLASFSLDCLSNFSGTFSIIFGLITFHYFVYINIFIIWYLLSFCFDFCIGLCIIFES